MHDRPPRSFTTARKICLSNVCGITLVTLLAAAANQTGCGAKSEGAPSGSARPAAPAPVEVRLIPISTLPAERFIELTGTLFGQEEVTVAAKVSGRIVEISADLGDAVPHGGKLAQVETTDYVLASSEARSAWLAALARLGLAELPEGDIDLSTLPVVARARAQAANSEARLERARKLYDRTPPLISEQEFADIQTQNEVAQTEVQGEEINARALLADVRVRGAALALAEQRLADSSVIAPAELPLRYLVAERRVSVGEYVSAGTPMFRLVAADRVKFRGSVPERFAGQISVGATAQLESEGYPHPVEARVVRISPAVDRTSRAFEIEIEADNPEQRLKPGGFLRARVRTQIDKNARFVPATSLAQLTGAQRLYTVRDAKVVELRVRTGERQGELIEVFDVPNNVTEVIDHPGKGIGPGTPARVVE